MTLRVGLGGKGEAWHGLGTVLGIVTPPSCPTAQLSGYIYTFSTDTETQAQEHSLPCLISAHHKSRVQWQGSWRGEGKERQGKGEEGVGRWMIRQEIRALALFPQSLPEWPGIGHFWSVLRQHKAAVTRGGQAGGTPHDWPEGERLGCGGGLWASPTSTPS